MAEVNLDIQKTNAEVVLYLPVDYFAYLLKSN